MKLKYYLRGVGIGIIFATLVMALSSAVHNNNLSDEFIIKEAMKLGMVMKEDSEEDIFSKDESEQLEDTEYVADTEDTEMGETEVVVLGSETESESESESQVESESQSEVESESQSEAESESQSEVESESESESEATPGPETNEGAEYVTIVVSSGDYARQVAEKLYAAGLIPNAEEFRIYMGEHGYAKTIHAGTYQIPVGASYEEICKIVAG